MPTEADFYHQLYTSPIDADKVSEDPSTQPFSSEIGPQASTSKQIVEGKINKQLEYVERKNSGRTLTETVSKDTVIWGGKFEADIFGARDVKGTRHGNPAVTLMYPGSNEYRIKGLLTNTSGTFNNVISEELRDHGLPTEHITAIYKLNEVLLDGKRLPVDEYKSWALEEFKSRNKDNPEKIEEVRKFLETATLYAFEREFQTAERVRDIACCKTERDFKRVLSAPLKWINTATAVKNSSLISGTEAPKPFDLENDEDIERYLSQWLPSQMGTYLGRFTNLGFVNHYPHAQNWSLAGTMYDLDSVTGEPLQQKVTPKEQRIDVAQSMGALEELLNPEGGNYISSKYPNLLIQAKINFIKGYITERGWPKRLSYRFFMNNSFHDGRNTYSRFITPDEWSTILDTLGFPHTEEDTEAWRKYYDEMITV